MALKRRAYGDGWQSEEAREEPQDGHRCVSKPVCKMRSIRVAHRQDDREVDPNKDHLLAGLSTATSPCEGMSC